VQPITQTPDLSNLFNSADNTMHFGASHLKFYAHAEIIIPQLSKVGAPVKIHSTLTNVALTSKFGKIQKDQGDIPQLTFSDAKAQLDKHIEIESRAFIFKDILAMITNNWFGLRDTMIKTLDTALSNPTSYTQFNKYINDALVTGYPTYYEIPEQRIRVSTYTSGGIKVHDKGLYLPLEGFFYDVDTGYNGTYQCGDLPDVINYDDETHDAVLVIGECAA